MSKILIVLMYYYLTTIAKCSSCPSNTYFGEKYKLFCIKNFDFRIYTYSEKTNMVLSGFTFYAIHLKHRHSNFRVYFRIHVYLTVSNSVLHLCNHAKNVKIYSKKLFGYQIARINYLY